MVSGKKRLRIAFAMFLIGMVGVILLIVGYNAKPADFALAITGNILVGISGITLVAMSLRLAIEIERRQQAAFHTSNRGK